MTKRESFNGKPYAGNPHVRFDEGENASVATSRRGSLICNRLWWSALAVVSAVTALHAETWFFDAAYAKANNVAYPFGAKSGASDGWQSSWTNSVGTRASSFDKEVDVLVVSHGVQCAWNGYNTSFPAKSLQIGEEDGTSSGVFYHKRA